VQTALKGSSLFGGWFEAARSSYATGIQDAGVLDDLYYYPGKLGVLFHHGDNRGWHDWDDDDNCDVKLKLWAPTAQSVSAQIFNHEADTTPPPVVAMHDHNGVWVADGDSELEGQVLPLQREGVGAGRLGGRHECDQRSLLDRHRIERDQEPDHGSRFR
jgi:hypothetical protein